MRFKEERKKKVKKERRRRFEERKGDSRRREERDSRRRETIWSSESLFPYENTVFGGEVAGFDRALVIRSVTR